MKWGNVLDLVIDEVIGYVIVGEIVCYSKGLIVVNLRVVIDMIDIGVDFFSFYLMG